MSRLTAVVMTSLMVIAGLSAPAHADAPRAGGELLDLGVAMEEPNVRFTTSGSDGAGHPLYFAVSDGHPAAFYAVERDIR